MTSRQRLVVAATATLVVAATAIWWFVLRSDAPPPVALDDAIAVASSAPTEDVSGIDGVWVVTPGGDSFAGYRVAEELAGIGFTEAAGRTSDVDATLAVADGSVATVDVTVDMRTLRSDDSRRDGRLRTQGIETDTFPTSTFSLTAPIALPDSAAAGDPFSVAATGDLTLHGVTRSVELALEAQLLDGIVVVVGSVEVLFEDFDITAPTAGIVLSVDDRGVIEFQLLFVRE